MKRYVVVVNPRGGRRRGLDVLEKVRPTFREASVSLDVHLTEYREHATEITRTLDLAGYDAICVIGGDGTVHEVVNGLMQREERVSIPLGLIPAGTGNSLHHHIRCSDPIGAAQCMLQGKTLALDVARVTLDNQVKYCVNIIGWGATADINRTAEKLRLLGPIRYNVAALWQILRPIRRRARLVLDDETVEDEFLFAIACNTKSTGSGMVLAPQAEIDDGKLDVVVLRSASPLQLLKLFRSVFDGSHLNLSYVDYRQVRSFAVIAQTHQPLNLDGENQVTVAVSGEVLPGALRILGYASQPIATEPA